MVKLNENRHWTIGMWCQQLGLSSTSTMNMILNEKRHAGQKVIDALVRYFKFDYQSEDYFRTLVKIQKKLKEPQLMMVFWENYHQSINAETNSKEGVIDNRVHVMTYVLRELSTLSGFKNDPRWIKEKLVPLFPKYHESFYREYMETLLVKNYISFDKDRNRLWPSRPTAKNKELRPSQENIKKFHQEIMETTKKAIDVTPKEKRTFQTSYLTISSDNFEKAMSLITEFQDKFSELMEEKEGSGDSLCQLNLQFFELASTHVNPIEIG